ncbi:peroxiredoxin [Zhihengliuella somnathii]
MELLPPGTRVPEFTTVNQHGERVTPGRLPASYFLVFYPFAFSRVCTAELGELERRLPDLERRGVHVAAVSVDHRFSLRAYAEQEGLSFPLLSDFWPHGAVARRFGCFDREHGRALRATYLVEDGEIAASFGSAVGEARPWQAYQDALEGRSPSS